MRSLASSKGTLESTEISAVAFAGVDNVLASSGASCHFAPVQKQRAETVLMERLMKAITRIIEIKDFILTEVFECRFWVAERGSFMGVEELRMRFNSLHSRPRVRMHKS
jgi:hypothetical protein